MTRVQVFQPDIYPLKKLIRGVNYVNKNKGTDEEPIKCTY